MNSLTIGTALFVFFILVPGFVNLWASGRSLDISGSFVIALVRGVLIFFSFFLVFAGYQAFRGTLVADKLILAFSGNPEPLKGAEGASFFLICVVLIYGMAFISGLLQLFLEVRLRLPIRAMVSLRRKLAGRQTFEVSPYDDTLRNVFLYYRLIGRRPYVTVMVSEHSISGEVLKFNYGFVKGMLLAEADNPSEIIWIPLNSVKAIRFKNCVELAGERVLRQSDRRFLELIRCGHQEEAQRE